MIHKNATTERESNVRGYKLGKFNIDYCKTTTNRKVTFIRRVKINTKLVKGKPKYIRIQYYPLRQKMNVQTDKSHLVW